MESEIKTLIEAQIKPRSLGTMGAQDVSGFLHELETAKPEPLEKHDVTGIDVPKFQVQDSPQFTGKKQLSVVESGPFAAVFNSKVMMLTHMERMAIQEANPELVVRLATEKEIENQLYIHPTIQDDGSPHQLELAKDDATEMTDQERYVTYKESMEWIYELAYKLWVMNNTDLLIMPDYRLIRWRGI